MNERTDRVRSTWVDTGIEHINNEIELGYSLRGIWELVLYADTNVM